MQNLYNRLKPDVLKGLKKNRNKYKFSVNMITAKLKSEKIYSSLSILDIETLETFSGINAGDGNSSTRWDFKFGDIWFYDWKYLDNELDNIEKDRINEKS